MLTSFFILDYLFLFILLRIALAGEILAAMRGLLLRGIPPARAEGPSGSSKRIHGIAVVAVSRSYCHSESSKGFPESRSYCHSESSKRIRGRNSHSGDIEKLLSQRILQRIHGIAVAKAAK